MRLCICLLAGVLHFSNFTLAQSSQEIIKINQSGYYPNATKIAVVAGDFSTEEYNRENFTFYILTLNSTDTVFKKPFGKILQSANSSLKTRIADFSEFKQAGNYLIYVPGIGTSYPFKIKENGSYASNEIAINWNAPAVYLFNAIEALQKRVEY